VIEAECGWSHDIERMVDSNKY